MSASIANLVPELQRAIEDEVARSIEAATKEIAERVTLEARKRLAAIACELFNSYSIQRIGHDLRITVCIAERK